MSAHPTRAIDAVGAEANLASPNRLMPQSNNTLRKTEAYTSQVMNISGTSLPMTAPSRCAPILMYALEQTDIPELNERERFRSVILRSGWARRLGYKYN